MYLKELRKIYNISQNEVSKIANIPIRTYRRYEQNDSYGSSLKREKLIETIRNHFLVDEEHGFLTIERIKEQVIPILTKNNICKCYLFGSYAKVDLLVDTDITGLQYFGLVEEIRNTLHKKVDLLRLKDIQPNNPIALEILKTGVKLI